MVLDMSLNAFIIPRIPTLTPPWGTKQTDPDHPGLSTLEAVNDLMMPFNRMRPFVVTENSSTTVIESSSLIVLSGEITELTLGESSYTGCDIKIINETDHYVNIVDDVNIFDIAPDDILPLVYNDGWRLNVYIPVGTIVEQKPDTKSPVESRLPGAWEIWSDRAVLYGLSQTALPETRPFYSTLIGTSVAAGSYCTKDYAGIGRRVYRANTAIGLVPSDFNPIEWTALGDDLVEERQKCGNKLVDDDLEIGDTVTVLGTDYYVAQVISLQGIFLSVEGGNRPTFISGGAQGDRIRNITGNEAYLMNYYISPPENKGALYRYGNGSTAGLVSGGASENIWRIGLDTSLVVPVGPDNAPSNLSKRLWRRVS
jgi:hypothetical protein